MNWFYFGPIALANVRSCRLRPTQSAGELQEAKIETSAPTYATFVTSAWPNGAPRVLISWDGSIAPQTNVNSAPTGSGDQTTRCRITSSPPACLDSCHKSEPAAQTSWANSGGERHGKNCSLLRVGCRKVPWPKILGM